MFITNAKFDGHSKEIYKNRALLIMRYVVWKYFVGKKFSWAMKPMKKFYTENFKYNKNEVYLCNCDRILEYYLH